MPEAAVTRPYVGTRSDPAAIEERFWRRVDQSGGLFACWPWTRRCDRKGYGVTTRIRGNHRSHRIAWSLVNGPIPADKFVLHHRDNPPCCNPAHLWLGTNPDNMLDMFAQDRQPAHLRPFAVCRAWLHPLNGRNRVVDHRGRQECRACRHAIRLASRGRDLAETQPPDPGALRRHTP